MSDRKIEGVEACSNHGCVFGHSGGMGTNGQCHCLDIRPPEDRIRATRNVLALRAALTAERERADRWETTARRATECAEKAEAERNVAEFALAAERERADKYEKAAAHFNRLMLERGVDIENLTAERDALRERNARMIGAIESLYDVARQAVDHADAANYASRQQEAIQRLADAYSTALESVNSTREGK